MGRFARQIDRPRQRIANEFRDQQVPTLVQHDLFATMSNTTNCSTALKTGDGRFQRLRARLLRSNQQEGQTVNFVERASPRACYAPGAYHSKRATPPDSVGVSIPWRCELTA